MADDIDHAVWPVGAAGKPTELHLVYPMMVFKHTKYPNAAKAFLAFLLERAQYERLTGVLRGLCFAIVEGLRVQSRLAKGSEDRRV
jgi:multiple sugar transport system substrate-binding protein